VSIKKLTKQLIDTLNKLEEITVQLEEQSVHVSLFYDRGNFGLYSNNASDRVKLGNVTKFDTLFDAKSNLNKIEEIIDDNTTKA
jgi:hypothetical protein